jgi:hypothetical protein
VKLTSNEQQAIVDALRDAASIARGDGNEAAHKGHTAEAARLWGRAGLMEITATRILHAARVECVR